MTTTEQPPSLADVRALSVDRRSAETDEVVGVLAWLERHLVDPRTSDDVAFPDYGDGELLLAGDGAPAVSEVAVVELITTLGMSDPAGRRYVGRALELKYRLPRLWRRVLDGEVQVWRAFKVAESTMSLPLDGAAFVDQALAPFAHSLSWSQLERTIERARAEFDPEEVQRRRDADPRRFDIRTGGTGVDGFTWVEGLMDAADALDLDAAVSSVAAQIGEYSDLPLDVRRSMAAGEIGRAQLALDLTDGPTGRGVDVSILMTDAQVAELRQTGTNVLLDQVASWCGSATTVTIRPVLDLNDHHRINGYVPTETIREQVEFTWPQCVFPFCTRRARRCDLDHRCPHGDGGATCPCNLAPLCRTHHRMKTFSGWTYEPADTTGSGIPTAFTWTSPEGNRFRVDARGSSPEP